MENPPTTEESAERLAMREVPLPPKLRDWRARLNTKAKQEKRFRFYSLYGLVCHPVTLRAAWDKVRANGGSPGVDGISIEHIEREGQVSFLEEIYFTLGVLVWSVKSSFTRLPKLVTILFLSEFCVASTLGSQ